MDEGVIEGGEDTSNAENELAYNIMSVGTMRMSGFGVVSQTHHLRTEVRERRSPWRHRRSSWEAWRLLSLRICVDGIECVGGGMNGEEKGANFCRR